MNNIDLTSILKLIEVLAPYIIPSVLLYLFSRRQQAANVRKTDSEVDSNLVQAAEKLVVTGGTLVSQLERQLASLDKDYKATLVSLEKVSRQHAEILEQFENLSILHRDLREKTELLRNALLEKDVKIDNLTKCVNWLLSHLRLLAVNLKLPKEWEVEKWVACAGDLNGGATTVTSALPQLENQDIEGKE